MKLKVPAKTLGIFTVALSALTLPSIALAGTSTRPIGSSNKSVVPMTSSIGSETSEDIEPATYDPLEGLNRGIFAFNHQLYRFVLRPIANLTEFIIPKPVLTSVGNAFVNVETPVRVVGSLLQGKFERAAQETGKLFVNSTLGIGGLFRPSDKIECLSKVPNEDVGQAFGKWGIPQGPYLVLPILGPSSCRELPGKAADLALNPLTWIGTSDLRSSLSATRAVQENPGRMKVYDLARKGALDEYIAVRESYISYRAEAVRR